MGADNFDGKLSQLALRRLTREWQSLEQEPLHKQGIYHSFDGDRMHKASAMIVGPDETPYAHGFYFFRFTFPNNYPHEPPRVAFWTGDGRVRFNPNLYSNGKVCLSILGTWDGPSWSGACTLRSTLLSLQSLLCSSPLQNEPGHSADDSEEARNYAKIISYESIAVTVMRVTCPLPAPLASFKEVMLREFLHNFSYYIGVLSNFDSMDGTLKECTVYGFVTEFRPLHIKAKLSGFRQELLHQSAWKHSLEEGDTCKPEAFVDDLDNIADLTKVVIRCALLAAANLEFSEHISTTQGCSSCEKGSVQCNANVASNEDFADPDPADKWAAMDTELSILDNEEHPLPHGLRCDDAVRDRGRNKEDQWAAMDAELANLCNEVGDEECPICYRQIERGVELPCGHCFCADCLLEVVVEYKQKDCPMCRGVLYADQCKAPASERSSALFSYLDDDDVTSSPRGFTFYFFFFDWFWYCSITKSNDRDDTEGLLDSFRESIQDVASAREDMREAPHGFLLNVMPPQVRGFQDSPHPGDVDREPGN